jgi:hypothetical protein
VTVFQRTTPGHNTSSAVEHVRTSVSANRQPLPLETLSQQFMWMWYADWLRQFGESSDLVSQTKATLVPMNNKQTFFLITFVDKEIINS